MSPPKIEPNNPVDYLAVYDATKGFTSFPVHYSEVLKRKLRFEMNLRNGEYTLGWLKDMLEKKWKVVIGKPQYSMEDVFTEYSKDIRMLSLLMFRAILSKVLK